MDDGYVAGGMSSSAFWGDLSIRLGPGEGVGGTCKERGDKNKPVESILTCYNNGINRLPLRSD